MTEKLLKLRKEMKSKKPDFIRQNKGKKSLKLCWRQPKGGHSKLRMKKGGHLPHPSMGFSSPKAVRHLHPSGLKERIISNINQLNTLQKNEGIIISARVGLRKKLDLLNKIKELKLPLLNIKNIDEFIKQTQEKQSEKIKEKKAKEEKKKQKEAEAEKKAKVKEKKEETPEDKEKKQKEEKRKILEGK